MEILLILLSCYKSYRFDLWVFEFKFNIKLWIFILFFEKNYLNVVRFYK